MNPYSTDELAPPHGTDDDTNFLPPLAPPPPGTIRYIDIHVYDQPAGEEDDPADIESTLDERPTIVPGNEDQDTQELTTSIRPRQYRKFVPLFFAVVSLLIIVTIVAVTMILPLYAPTATITIIQVSREISTTTTLTVTTGQTGIPGQLTGRALPTMTMSQAQTIKTTGLAHQDTQAAHGLVVFYNTAPYAQTVGAGTLLTGADSSQIVTDQDATIPAGNLATNGQVSVMAHAITPGPAGNIQAGDVYGQCCRVDVFVRNTAFTGGQQAREYHTVTKQDIINAVTSLSASLTQSVQTALQTQVQPSETLITPLPCTQTVTPEHAAGSEATQDHVTVTETCTGTAYPTQSYQRMTTQIIAQQAHKQLGDGYMLIGPSQSTMTQVATTHGTPVLHIHVSGTYVYQFSQEQQLHIKAAIAGKSKAQATAIVLGLPGVQTVSVTTRNGETLPTDTAHIQLVFLLMQ